MKNSSTYMTVEELNHYAKRAKDYKLKDFSVLMVEYEDPSDLTRKMIGKFIVESSKHKKQKVDK